MLTSTFTCLLASDSVASVNRGCTRLDRSRDVSHRSQCLCPGNLILSKALAAMPCNTYDAPYAAPFFRAGHGDVSNLGRTKAGI